MSLAETNSQLHQNPFELPSDLETYAEDGRMPIEALYKSYEAFLAAGWQYEVVATQTFETADGRSLTFPILAFYSQSETEVPVPTFWAMSGVHGEEPAGPMAFAHKIPEFIAMAKEGMPMMVMPMLNPAGYYRDWRYENERRNYKKGQSVTDSSEYLDPVRPPLEPPPMPVGETAKQVIKWILQKTVAHPPEMVIDHHEDELESNPQVDDPQQFYSYLYFYGDQKYLFIAEDVAGILRDSGMPISPGGQTRFGENIPPGGVVPASPDGSVDELLAARQRFDLETNQIIDQPFADLVIVVETTRNPDGSITLEQRVMVQEKIIERYRQYWAQKRQIKDSQNS